MRIPHPSIPIIINAHPTDRDFANTVYSIGTVLGIAKYGLSKVRSWQSTVSHPPLTDPTIHPSMPKTPPVNKARPTANVTEIFPPFLAPTPIFWSTREKKQNRPPRQQKSRTQDPNLRQRGWWAPLLPRQSPTTDQTGRWSPAFSGFGLGCEHSSLHLQNISETSFFRVGTGVSGGDGHVIYVIVFDGRCFGFREEEGAARGVAFTFGYVCSVG